MKKIPPLWNSSEKVIARNFGSPTAMDKTKVHVGMIHKPRGHTHTHLCKGGRTLVSGFRHEHRSHIGWVRYDVVDKEKAAES